MPYSFLTELKCSRCGKTHSADSIQTVCTSCKGTLFCQYDVEKAKERLTKENLTKRAPSLWRYGEMLPVRDEKNIVTLGEGYTPITHLERIGERLALNNLYVKDDGVIPTGTFKSRGMASAIAVCTSTAAPSISRLRSNCKVIDVEP